MRPPTEAATMWRSSYRPRLWSAALLEPLASRSEQDQGTALCLSRFWHRRPKDKPRWRIARTGPVLSTWAHPPYAPMIRYVFALIGGSRMVRIAQVRVMYSRCVMGIGG